MPSAGAFRNAGRFDKIVSIEMLEAAGDQYLATCFGQVIQRPGPLSRHHLHDFGLDYAGSRLFSVPQNDVTG